MIPLTAATARIDGRELATMAANVIGRGSKSFAAATRLFPAETRNDVMLLYAWCRHCDDVIDGQQLGWGSIQTASDEVLQHIKHRSFAALAGDPEPELPFLALADLARRHPIDRALLEDHIRGFELDVAGWQPETLEDTLQYCYHMAGTVGIMMAKIMAVQNRTTLLRASDLGIAFQLTNIARDVVEDAAAGRSYLPGEWLKATNLTVADLTEPSAHERAFPLVQRLLEEAEPYYQSAALGVRALPRRAAWAVGTARTVYRDIGNKLLESGPGALSERVYTSGGLKFWRVLNALPGALLPRKIYPNNGRNKLLTPSEPG